MVYEKKTFKKRSSLSTQHPELSTHHPAPRTQHHSSPRGPLAPLMTEEAKQAADIQTLSYDFACRITRLFQYLTEDSEYKEFIFSKQVVRSGTSIGANISEAMHPQSDADFLSKANISLKEARETNYWLNLLHDNGYLDDRQYSSLDNDLQRILKILVTIVGKVAKRLNSEKASKKPSSRIPDIPNSRTPDFPNSRIPELPNSRIPEFPISRIPELPISRIPELPISRIPELPNSITQHSAS